ncbi:hypothetical protein K493DRAFT_361137 [Basidiobolus meristosporus CBS 931.73]|uniref:Uncharacterized protein n=1 Tax=Basidiobolus meristosporus CBS 931.73 TaxID=1314790 RepID=A0A1Y1XC13_9FUNG|nr:hypothetical protein K493DRAFT_361137 [Basidiobolus meristosporus CBS 931.73]|eukprot:ORX83253.1 hypothetical protein K493DRAFT_361137 [Basidiobolus meristosporus CBS 931.73]
MKERPSTIQSGIFIESPLRSPSRKFFPAFQLHQAMALNTCQWSLKRIYATELAFDDLYSNVCDDKRTRGVSIGLDQLETEILRSSVAPETGSKRMRLNTEEVMDLRAPVPEVLPTLRIADSFQVLRQPPVQLSVADGFKWFPYYCSESSISFEN